MRVRVSRGGVLIVEGTLAGGWRRLRRLDDRCALP